MKIKTTYKDYDEVMALPQPKHKKPTRASLIFQTLVRLISVRDLWRVRFSFSGSLPKKQDGPCFILMNHSSFIDLKIAYKLLYGRKFSIVCTHDALVGKRWLMRRLGCFPTRKFVTDLTLVRDIKHQLEDGVSVLMYPEAGYSFDGKSTVLPENLGGILKLLKVPVVYIETRGAFAHDPLYNGLQLRRVPVSARIDTLFTKEQVETLSQEELTARINLAFAFDNFAWQKENGIRITEGFRADGLERILYRCAHCHEEGCMKGEGTTLTCQKCGKSYTLTELGELEANDGVTEFTRVPDWYEWQRATVREELISGSYALDTAVDIGMMVDYKSLYLVGKGRLIHSLEGFHLTGCDGRLDYKQKALASYGLNADYFWYEIGDVISIGDHRALYYCFPPKEIPVAKARLATEELYKLHRDREFHLRHCKICDHEHHTVKQDTGC